MANSVKINSSLGIEFILYAVSRGNDTCFEIRIISRIFVQANDLCLTGSIAKDLKSD